MASFKTHLSFGIALGVLAAFAVLGLALVPAGFEYLLLLCLAGIVGAIMPDMDSDTGVPFHVTFGSLALIAGGVTFMYMMRTVPGQYWMIAAYTLGAMFTVWVAIGTLFKKLTVHRGMAHSVPAAVLASLVVFTVAVRAGMDPWQSFLLGLSLLLGYVLHLVLDEFVSAVNFHGTPFVPNAALGSALKFRSNSMPVNLFVYLAILTLCAGNGGVLLGFARRLIDAV